MPQRCGGRSWQSTPLLRILRCGGAVGLGSGGRRVSGGVGQPGGVVAVWVGVPGCRWAGVEVGDRAVVVAASTVGRFPGMGVVVLG